MKREHRANGRIELSMFLRAAYGSKAAGLAGAAAIFAAVLLYAFGMREPYSASTRVFIGHVAAQPSANAPTTFIAIESLDLIEGYVREEISQGGCSAKGRRVERTPAADPLYRIGGALHLSCAAGSENEARRRVEAVANRLITEHQERLKFMLQPLLQQENARKRSLMLLKDMEGRLRNQPARTAGAAGEPAAWLSYERFLMSKELLAVANEIASIEEELKTKGELRKLDRTTRLDQAGVVVTRKRFTPLMAATALLLSLAFGVFVSLTLAAVRLLRESRHGGDGNV